MFWNLIRNSLRSLKRQRSNIIINITGLSIGIGCSLLIALYIFYEISFDSFNLKKDRIFNVVTNFKIGGEEFSMASSSSPIGSAMLTEFPEVEDFLRMKQKSDAKTLTYNNQVYNEENIIEADSSFFNFFTIPLLRGDQRVLLNSAEKIVLSSSVAKKIFGDKNPTGKVIKVGRDTSSYIVSGVMEDIPGNSHFRAGAVVSMLSDKQSFDQEWGNNHLNTYVLLKPNADYETVNEKLKQLVIENIGPLLERILKTSFDEFLSGGNKYAYYIQNLTDIHLNTFIKPHFLPAGDPQLLKILGAIALVILLVAAVNFTNLSTAQASARARETGIKKIVGSSRTGLIIQFLSESVLMSLISTVIAVILIVIALPYFNDMFDTDLTPKLSDIRRTVPFILIFSLITGILAGAYPAFFLSSFSPYKAIKGTSYNNSYKGSLRKVLVVLQFTISISLIVGTLIMYRQITFMQNKDQGFDNSRLMVLEDVNALGRNARSFKETIAGFPGVAEVTSSSCVPGKPADYNGYSLEGKKDETLLMWTNYVDYNFLQTYGMTIKSGRSFSKEYASDGQTCILNESAIKDFNIDPQKMRIAVFRDSGKYDYLPIIGVVNDFIFDSQKNKIGPYIFRLRPETENRGFITIKLARQNYNETIDRISSAWKKSASEVPIRYSFIENMMDQLYKKERQNAIIAVIASTLAILIAVLGLYGLTSFTVEQRTKEIGIRKAAGSSVMGICSLITKSIIVLIMISAVFSIPLVYYLSGKWLENFYYRIKPGILTFIAGLAIAIIITLLTTGYRTLRAARANPARSLRYD